MEERRSYDVPKTSHTLRWAECKRKLLDGDDDREERAGPPVPDIRGKTRGREGVAARGGEEIYEVLSVEGWLPENASRNRRLVA